MTALLALFLTVASIPAAAPEPPPPPVYAYTSAYSCDAHQNNRMYPCGAFRDGSTPSSDLHWLVAACPLERLGQRVRVAGVGVVECRDTPQNGVVNGLDHIDLFLPYGEAVGWGIQVMEIEWMPRWGQERKGI